MNFNSIIYPAFRKPQPLPQETGKGVYWDGSAWQAADYYTESEIDTLLAGYTPVSHANDSSIHFTQSNITTLGTITSGVWNGTALGANYVPNHDSLNGFVANEHIDWTDATSTFKTTGELYLYGNLNTDKYLESNTNLFLGIGVAGAGNISHTTGAEGWYNIGIGFEALKAITTGSQNLGIGTRALTAITSAYYNTAIGYNALTSNQTGSFNTAIGYFALKNVTGAGNIGIGYTAGDNITTGTYNIIIGNVDADSATGNYQLNIGGLIKGDLSAGHLKIVLPTSDPAIAGVWWNDAGTVKISTG